MKKFIIISVVLLLLAAGLFGFAMYRYLQVNDLLGGSKQTQKAEEATEAAQDDAAVKTPANKETPSDDQKAAPAADVFADGTKKAETYLAELTDEQMVGQLLLGVCSDPSTAAAQMNQYSLAGMLFVSDNFQGMSAEEISAAMKNASSEAKIKPILAAQEEGGTYTTLSDLSAYPEYDFNAPRSEYDAGGLQGVEKAEESKVTLLKSAGFNMNLCPVVDLASSSDQIMYSRSISDNADTVSEYAEYVAKFNQAKGVSAVLSHFPGYGTVPDSADDGMSAVEDDRAADTIRGTDYTPFKKGAAAGVHAIMMSNTVVKNLDAAHTAALSPAIHSELRKTVGFSGLIMTDLLDDRDYSAYAEGNKPAVQAVLAGNDLILVRDYATAYNDILEAVKAGKISEAQLKEACTRVIAYKYTVGIMK